MLKVASILRRLAFLAVLALVTTLAVGQAPAAAAPAAPTNLTPTGDVSTTTPTLAWSKVSGAVKYDVQVDDSPDFTTLVFDGGSTTNSRLVPTKHLPAGDLYWRVRAINASGASSPWSTSMITVAPTAPPTPLSPVGGAVLDQPEEAPLLTWAPTQGATSYTIEVDNEDGFVVPLSYSTKTTSFVIPDPLEAGAYFWRVQASKGAGLVTEFSETADFWVSPLDDVVLASPANDAVVTDVVLDWEPVDGAHHYEVQVSPEASFATFVDQQTTVYGTRYSPKTTYNNGQYYWRVRSYDLGNHPSDWSTTRTFQRDWTETITPQFPVAGAITTVTTPMYFQWSPVTHASQYQLQLGTDPNFSPGTFASCLTPGTTYTPGAFALNLTTGSSSVRSEEDCIPTPGVDMYWRVRALDGPYSKADATTGVAGLFTAPEAFVFNPTYFANVLPANGATVDVPTFSWDPMRGAESYQIKIYKNGSSSPLKTATTFSTSYTPYSTALNPADGPFTWSLQAFEADGTPSAIGSRTFSLSGNLPDSGAAPMTALSGRSTDPATVFAPNLRWEPLEGAHHYVLEVGTAGSEFWFLGTSSDSFGEALPYPAVTDISTRLFTPGQYKWRVTAEDAGGNDLAVSAIEVFTIAPLPPVTGHRLALSGGTLAAGQGCSAGDCGTVPATPTFGWSPVPGAASYVVYVSKASNFTALTEPISSMSATANTRWTPTNSSSKSALEDNQAGQAYYWHVRPCKADGLCGPDPVSSTGNDGHSFRKVSPAVQLLGPVGGEAPVVTSGEVRFSWTDYLTTNKATTWGPANEQSNQAARQYRIQVDDSSGFASPLDDQLVDQTEYTSYQELYPDTPLWWRVGAVDADGNALTWSAPQAFQKSSPSAVLSSPIGSVQVGGATPFRWAPQPFNAGYRIEVYKNDDATFSSTNRVFYKDVKTSAYAHIEPLPASSVAYRWRVRRVDAFGNPGQWSATGRFFSKGSIPALFTPEEGLYQDPNGPLFSWSEVDDAATYKLEVRLVDALSAWKTISTAATAWAATSALPDGNWQWRVSALDAKGSALGTSPWRGFLVDGGRPTVVGYSPSSSGSPSANVKVTFSEPVIGVSKSTFRIKKKGTTTWLAATRSVSADKRRATLNPTSNLRNGATYVVQLTTGITDAKGNTLVKKSWSFKVT